MTTALFLLRCVELGIAIADLDYLTIGLILDVFSEKCNDDWEYPTLADQSAMDLF